MVRVMEGKKKKKKREGAFFTARLGILSCIDLSLGVSGV